MEHHLSGAPVKKIKDFISPTEMIEAFQRLQESRPGMQFVKTGVSSAPPPDFLTCGNVIAAAASEAPPILPPKEKLNFFRRKKQSLSKKTPPTVDVKSLALEIEKKISVNKADQIIASPLPQSQMRSNFMIRRRTRTGRFGWLQWFLEELTITMSKVSLAGLVFGLMILGILFFGIGFLAAVSTYGTKSDHPSWEQASQQQAAGPEKKGKPSALGKLGGAIGGSLIGQEATKIESRYGGGMLKGLTAAVPAPLKPFALQAQNQVSAEVQQTVNAGARDLKGTFTPSTYGSTPPPPPYHRAPSVTGQPPKPAFATPPASSAQLTQHGQHAPAQQHAQAQPFGAQAPAGGLGPAASQPMSTYSPPQQQMGQNTFYQQQQMAYQQQQNMAGMQPMGAPGMSGQPYSPNQPTQMMQPEARAYGSAPLAYAPPIYGAPSPQTQPGYQQGLAPNSYSANLQQPYTAPAGNMQQPYAYGAQPPHGYAPQPVQFVGMG